MSPDLLNLSLVALLLLLSAFFSSSETALFSLDSIKLRRMRRSKGFKVIHSMLNRSSLLLVTILLGNTIVNVAVSSLLEKQLQFESYLLNTVIITALLLFIGEITPKTLAIRNAEAVSLFNSRLLYPLFVVFRPLAAPLEALSNALLKGVNNLFRNREHPEQENHLDALLSLVSRGSFLDNDEKRLVESVLKFTGREVYNIMTPRNKLVSLECSLPVKKAVSLIKKSAYSKFPVYDETDDNIVGVLYLRDIYPYIHQLSDQQDRKIRDIMEDMYFVPETKRLTEMLEDFQKKKIRMATVVDEYGSAMGIVTIADVLSEIVGEFIDEKFDIQKKIIGLSNKKYLVSGDTSLGEFNEYFKTTVSSEDFETLAGLVIEKAGDIPPIGFSIEIDKWKVTVRDRSTNYIDKFLVERR